MEYLSGTGRPRPGNAAGPTPFATEGAMSRRSSTSRWATGAGSGVALPATRIGPQAVAEDGEDPIGLLIVRRRMTHRKGRSGQESHDVVDTDVHPDGTGLLGPLEEFVQSLDQREEDRGRPDGEAESVRTERLDDVTLLGSLAGQERHERQEGGARFGSVEPFVTLPGQLGHPIQDDGLEQRLFRGEVSVDRSRTDARFTGDLVERRIGALGRKCCAGGNEDPIPVALRVGSQRAGPRTTDEGRGLRSSWGFGSSHPTHSHMTNKRGVRSV